MSKDAESYQTATLTLQDGRKVTFSGRAQVKKGDVVLEVTFSEPKPLPQGCCFEEIGGKCRD